MTRTKFLYLKMQQNSFANAHILRLTFAFVRLYTACAIISDKHQLAKDLIGIFENCSIWTRNAQNFAIKPHTNELEIINMTEMLLISGVLVSEPSLCVGNTVSVNCFNITRYIDSQAAQTSTTTLSPNSFLSALAFENATHNEL